MRRSMVMVVVLSAACSSTAEPTTVAETTTTVQATTSSTLEPLVECPPIPYEVGTLPPRVTTEPVAPESVEVDEFTAIGGTRSIFWTDEEGALAVALVRGSLPPRDWPGERGEVEGGVAGTRAVAGPFPDGKWVIAWFEGEGEDRCDLYTMVFYPPVSPSEVQESLASMTRRG
jgi:hypothetical protein